MQGIRILLVDNHELVRRGVRSMLEPEEAQQKLKQLADEWATTLDSIADLVSIHDKDFRLLKVNQAFADLFKTKPEKLVGKTCYQVVHGTNEPLPNCLHRQTLTTKKPAKMEYFDHHLEMYLEVTSSPIFDKGGEVTSAVHICRDITEHKRMEKQLIVTGRLASIGELASGIAHELNNPLTSIIGFSELVLKKAIPEDARDDLTLIHREAQRTSQIVRNLLTFAHQHPLAKQNLNINEVIPQVLELRTYEQKVNNIQVITNFAPDLPQIMADSFQLQQVFLNIIINAEYFMIETHKRGTLTISTERLKDVVRVSFADNGQGIPPKNLRRIFDPFFTTKETGKGTGLGLSICHGIVTEHGGRIYAESEPSKGATFIIELPISQ